MLRPAQPASSSAQLWHTRPCKGRAGRAGTRLAPRGLPQRRLARVVPPARRVEQPAEARGRVARAPGRHLARSAVARRVVARRVVPAPVRHGLRAALRASLKPYWQSSFLRHMHCLALCH